MNLNILQISGRKSLIIDKRYAYLLKMTSVQPLVALMREKGVNLLVGPSDVPGEGWYLDIDGNFRNAWSHGEKTGNVAKNPQDLFD